MASHLENRGQEFVATLRAFRTEWRPCLCEHIFGMFCSQNVKALLTLLLLPKYSAWNPALRSKFCGLDVRIMGCNRTRIIVEKIGLTKDRVTIEER